MKDLFNTLRDLMTYVEGQNNYEDNTLWINVYQDGIKIESGCINEYGSSWGNEDSQFIDWADIPNWVMKDLLGRDTDWVVLSR